MIDNMTATPAQKKEQTIEALVIAGFTENEQYPGMYAQINDDIKTVVDLTDGVSLYLYDIKLKCKINDGDDAGALDSIKKIITEAEDGRMPTKRDPDIIVNTGANEGTPEHPDDAQTEPVQTAPENVPAVYEVPQALTPSSPADLSVQTIKKYINDKATDEEAYVFLQLCKARGLNPFLKEAHLIKYSHTAPATMVVGKDAFTRKAEEHKQFDGFEAGIIVRVAEDTPAEERIGTFMDLGETLLGGWAKVYRKDHKHPSVCTVSLGEYSKPGRNGKPNSWDNIPATMIRKVALVQAHREAFSSEMSGMYDQSEMGVEVIT